MAERSGMREYEEYMAAESRRWLDYVSTILPKIRSCDNMLEVVRYMAEPKGIDYTKPFVNGSISKDIIADTVAAMEELMGRWGDERQRLTSELDDAMATINRLEDPRHVMLLERRYIEGMQWKDVADDLGYSEQACYKMHNDAAVALHRYLPSGWRTEIPDASVE